MGLILSGVQPRQNSGAAVTSLPDGRACRLLPACLWSRSRNNPACAGKSQWRLSHDRGNWDQPRTRGEKTGRTHRRLLTPGVTPHARGKLVELRDVVASLRINPAYAGKSVSARTVTRRIRDQPPRTRGKDRRGKHDHVAVRINPAYAGKSLRCGGPCRPLSDQPRIRGENT